MHKQPATRKELLEWLTPTNNAIEWPEYPKRLKRNYAILSDNRCPVLLVDVSSIAYHTFFTQCAGLKATLEEVPQIIQIKLLKQILELVQVFTTNKVLLCWDSKKSVRKEMYKQYKAKRHSALDEKEQKKILAMKKALAEFRRKIAPRLNINSLFQKGYESDDLIAVMTNTYKGTAIEFIIVANDADLFQLLRPNVQVLSITMKALIGVREFIARYRCHPRTVVAVKSISGCHSDNVKGIKGIGEKRMEQFLTGTLALDKRQLILDSWDIIKRNRKLVELPLEGVKLPKLHPCDWNLDGFGWVCGYLGIQNVFAKKGKGVDVLFKRVHRD